MLKNLGVPLNMYITETVGMSFPSAFTPSNVIKGFKRTGIAPIGALMTKQKNRLKKYNLPPGLKCCHVEAKERKETKTEEKRICQWC